MSIDTIARLATAKQLAFVNVLRSDRNLPLIDGNDPKWVTTTIREASELIDALKAMPIPAKTPAKPVAELEAGVYVNSDDDIIRVYRGQSGRMLAKSIDGNGAFTFLGLAIKYVKADQKITRERAAEFGQQTGVCCMCGRDLTDPESVAAGIGPICSGKF